MTFSWRLLGSGDVGVYRVRKKIALKLGFTQGQLNIDHVCHPSFYSSVLVLLCVIL